MKFKLKVLLFTAIFLISFNVLSDEPIPKNTSIYTSWKVYPVSGDCGGFTVTFVQKKLMTMGYLQIYEGNCMSSKYPAKLIKFDKKIGFTKFFVPDQRASKIVDAEWRFTGYIQKNKLTGRMQYCFIYTNECTSDEKITLTKTNHKTLE